MSTGHPAGEPCEHLTIALDIIHKELMSVAMIGASGGYVRDSQLSVIHAKEAFYTTYPWLIPRRGGSPLSVGCKAEKLEETRKAIITRY